MKLRMTIGLVMLIALSGCSIKLAYNNAERLVRWQIGEYIDLDPQQKAYFTEHFTALMHWHRTTQLPEYAEYLYVLAEQYSDAVTPAQVKATFDQITEWGERFEQQGMPIAIHMLASLSDEQVAELPPAARTQQCGD